MSDLRLFTNLTAATMTDSGTPYGLIRDAAIAVEGGTIRWVGPQAECPSDLNAAPTVDLGGRLVTPGLIDCHTHIVHGGSRAGEFEQRLNGASYEEIARAGGGIVSTVRATRAADEDTLLHSARRRAEALMAQGVTAIEIKSGYGLDQDTELRMLRVARRLAELCPLRVHTSFLGAHAVPAGQDADSYIDDVCIPALQAAAAEGLVDSVDGFCENIAFSAQQIERVFNVARDLGLPVRLHAEQLSHQGGVALAARFGALSADHLEYATAEDAAAMARAGMVAVLLPGAYYTLHETRMPPVPAFRSAGVPMAVATDWNPGSSPLGSLLLAMNMGCTLFGLTPEEALAGVTRNAARALGYTDCGVIAPTMRADLAIWDADGPGELAYHIGVNLLHQRLFGGAA